MPVAFDSALTAAVRIGACQTPEILGDVDAAVRCIRGFCAQAKREGADLLLFPECFLQGYLVTEAPCDCMLLISGRSDSGPWQPGSRMSRRSW